MRKTRWIFCVLLFLCTGKLYGFSFAEIKGIVQDEAGNPVPNATIYIEKTTLATATNAEGRFSLSVPARDLMLVVRSVGYRQYSKQIMAGNTEEIKITLEREVFALEAVEIVQREDPAYAIIRKAIERRPIHLKETPAHQVKAYIKGTQWLLEAPSKFLGINIDEIGREIGLDSNRTGIIYLSESESILTVNPPSQIKEEMISSRVAGSNRAFSFNRASDLQFNLYQNHDPIVEGLSSRPFISPIADQALRYYHYKYLGFVEENGHSIFKIAVTPRRKGEPLYEGIIYLMDGSWRLYSVDLSLTKESSIAIVDSVRISQHFIPLPDGHWFPASTQLDFHAGLLGFQIAGNFSAVFSDYQLRTDLQKRDFREALAIGADANTKDADYWAQIRPLPLTVEEQQDYLKKDSLSARRETPAYLDSIDKQFNTFKISHLIGGYTYRNRAKAYTISTGSLLNSFSFNTVEGAVINHATQFRKRLDTISARSSTLTLHLRYGFLTKKLDPSLSWQYEGKNNSRYSISAGSDVLDLNHHTGFPVLFNTAYTLFIGENHLKLYGRDFANFTWNHTFPGNIGIVAALNWESRRWMHNRSTYSFRSAEHTKFTPNNPWTDSEGVALFPHHQALDLTFAVNYHFSSKYETWPSGRRYLSSRFPTVSLRYKQGIPKLLGSASDFQLLQLGLRQNDLPLGTFGKLSFQVEAGYFLKTDSLEFPDYKQFSGTKTVVGTHDIMTFLLLDPYQFSTASHFLQGHLQYNLSGILTSKIPLIRKYNLQEIIGLHYLHTEEKEHYLEFHAGMQWQNVRVTYAQQGPHQALRFTIGF